MVPHNLFYNDYFSPECQPLVTNLIIERTGFSISWLLSSNKRLFGTSLNENYKAEWLCVKWWPGKKPRPSSACPAFLPPSACDVPQGTSSVLWKQQPPNFSIARIMKKVVRHPLLSLPRTLTLRVLANIPRYNTHLGWSAPLMIMDVNLHSKWSSCKWESFWLTCCPIWLESHCFYFQTGLMKNAKAEVVAQPFSCLVMLAF